MNKAEKEKVLAFIRGARQSSWRLDQGGNIDMYHPDNIEKIRRSISEARSDAFLLKIKAEEIERIMDWANKRGKIMVTEEMRAAGSQIASDLMDAQVSSHMGGLGGSKDWEEFELSYNGKHMDLIKQYVNGEIDSVTAIYIAMHRVSF